ncbi:hypothetical protein [Vibrio phage VP4B]|uniref:Uncharacterized protein n=1 Tax=Vibrio phage VP4B TaxID=1262540 RepID=V9M0B1_9CAUD|nr:hypothetical protein FDJ61_gp152 [Vibrio phage VP4B]AGB07266.1 hypothetical protein [Vibrio phage VP4B]
MCDVLNHSVPFLSLALDLSELDDFKAKLQQIHDMENLPLDIPDDVGELCKHILYGKQWYRGDSELPTLVSVVFWSWLSIDGTIKGILDRARRYFYLLGELNFKFFEHLNVLYHDYNKHKQ